MAAPVLPCATTGSLSGIATRLAARLGSQQAEGGPAGKGSAAGLVCLLAGRPIPQVPPHPLAGLRTRAAHFQSLQSVTRCSCNSNSNSNNTPWHQDAQHHRPASGGSARSAARRLPLPAAAAVCLEIEIRKNLGLKVAAVPHRRKLGRPADEEEAAEGGQQYSPVGSPQQTPDAGFSGDMMGSTHAMHSTMAGCLDICLA